MIRNRTAWLKAFSEIFEELNNRELSPHAYYLFNQEFLVHKQAECAWFRCNICHRTWHSFKAYVEFTYGVKKEGKPKRRVGKVNLVPYGQKCQKCFQTGDEDPASEVFLYPVFGDDAINRTLLKVRDIVERRLYTERPYQPDAIMYGGRRDARRDHRDAGNTIAPGIRKMRVRGDPDVRRKFDAEKDEDYSGFSSLSISGDNESGFEEYVGDNDDDGDIVDITDGPHKTDLCEACSKGKCSQGLNYRSRTSSDVEVKLTNSFQPSPMPNFSKFNEEPNLSKVKWHLSIKQL